MTDGVADAGVPKKDVVGAVSASLLVTGPPNNDVAAAESGFAPKAEVRALLAPKPPKAEVELGWLNSPKGDGLACDTGAPNAETGPLCAGLVDSSLDSISALDFSVIVAEGCKVAELPKVGAVGISTEALERKAEFAKKFGIDEVLTASSFASTSFDAAPVPNRGGFGVGGVRDIDGNEGTTGASAEALREPPVAPVGGAARAGLFTSATLRSAAKAGTCSVAAAGLANEKGSVVIGASFGAAGLLNENGRAAIGGSFASLASRLIGET